MKKFTFMAIIALTASFNMNGGEYYCSPQGSGEMDGSSWDNAVPAENLTDVLETIETGDIIHMLEGTYFGTNVKPVLGITVIGGYPATAKGTDISGYNPWVYRTVFDAKGNNGTESLIKVSGIEGEECPLTTFKGITITGCKGQQTDTYSGTAFNCTRAYVLLEDVTFKGNTSWKGGCVVPASGSRFHARHCVWEDNRNVNTTIGSSDGANNCFQPILNGRGSSSNVTNIVLEGCVMVNNTIESEEARKVACYGGGLSFQDGSCNLMMINCFADGAGQTIKQNGGFMRMGNNSSLLLLAFNTFFNYSTSSSESKGKIVSINGNIPYYLQGNIIVDNTAGTTVTPDYSSGTVINGNKSDIAIFTQGFSSNHGKKIPSIASGGDNTIGGILVATIQKDQNGEEGSLYKTTFLTDFQSDNWSAPAQNEVFAGNTTAKDGRYYILPKESYRDVKLSDALEIFDSYKADPAYECFKWANVDLSLDLFGNKRAATTYRGAYDVNASSIPSGINEMTGIYSGKLSSVSLGNGSFAIYGAQDHLTVFNMSGETVRSIKADGRTVVSLEDLPSGIYIARSNGASVKIIK